MRILLATALVIALAGGAIAQPQDYEYLGANMAIFFDTNFESTNTDAPLNTPVSMYMYLLNPPVGGSRGFEGRIRGGGGITFGVNSFILSLTFEPGVGALNLGDNQNILCGYAFVQPVVDNALKLATWQIMFGSAGTIELGPAQPSSVFYTGMAYLEQNPDDLRKAGWATGLDPYETGTQNQANPPFHVMATVHGGGVVQTENQSLTQVKALFQ